MKRVLDTNVCIDVLRRRSAVIARLRACKLKDCYLSSVTEFELYQGADRAAEEWRETERERVEQFVSPFQILGFDSECARLAGRINASLLNAGTPISITDVFIGATALRHNCLLVTSNTRDFERIEGLKLENWR